jgi:hypothetical protein
LLSSSTHKCKSRGKKRSILQQGRRWAEAENEPIAAACFSILKTEVANFLRNIIKYLQTYHHIPEDSSLNSAGCENPEPGTKLSLQVP